MFIKTMEETNFIGLKLSISIIKCSDPCVYVGSFLILEYYKISCACRILCLKKNFIFIAFDVLRMERNFYYG